MHRSLIASMFSGLIIGVLAPPAAAQSPEQIEKIKAAAPAESYAKPAKPRNSAWPTYPSAAASTAPPSAA